MSLTQDDLRQLTQWGTSLRDVHPAYWNADGFDDEALLTKILAYIGLACGSPQAGESTKMSPEDALKNILSVAEEYRQQGQESLAHTWQSIHDALVRLDLEQRLLGPCRSAGEALVEIHKVSADLLKHDASTWPSHNFPLALCAALALRVADSEELKALKARPEEPYHLNSSRSVVVGNERFISDFTNCPRGAKVQLLGPGCVAVYGIYDGDPQWRGWYPVPGMPIN